MSDLLTPADIEQRAKDAGMAIGDVCRRAGIAPSTWSRWKRGLTEPTLDVYRRLRDAVSQPAAPADPDAVASDADRAAKQGAAPTVAPHRHSVPEAA